MFIGKDGSFEELINHKFETNGNVFENRAFIAQLKSYFSDCPTITIPLKMPYSTSAISELILKYNSCKSSVSTVFGAKEKVRTKCGLTMMTAFDQFNPSFTGGFGYGAGVFVNFNFPDRNYRLSLFTELGYRKTADQSNSKGELYKINSLQFSSILRLRILPNYEKLLVGGGISVAGGLSDEYYYTSRGQVLGTSARSNFAILANVCWVLSRKMSTDIRYESADSIVIDDSAFGNGVTGRSSSLRLTLSYWF